MYCDLLFLEDVYFWVYFCEEIGGFFVGLFEFDVVFWNVSVIFEIFVFGEIDLDWDCVVLYLEVVFKWVLLVVNVGICKLFCGLESFMLDLVLLVGEVFNLCNCWVVVGLNLFGIFNGLGIGMVLVYWIVDGYCLVDYMVFNVD